MGGAGQSWGEGAQFQKGGLAGVRLLRIGQAGGGEDRQQGGECEEHATMGKRQEGKPRRSAGARMQGKEGLCLCASICVCVCVYVCVCVFVQV